MVIGFAPENERMHKFYSTFTGSVNQLQKTGRSALRNHSQSVNSGTGDKCTLWPVVQFTNGEKVLFKCTGFSVFNSGMKLVRYQVGVPVRIPTLSKYIIRCL
jgi:hypothetical protein